ncbi:MAG: hypothetical protein AB199_03230 [Parcubacteria bacterium C7867-004]|nr:MAG: hypothetical protein AB199_03230 [Parcubacteria bacterium C7867-004]
MEEEYIRLRNAYLPKKLSTVFILESPPEGHGYFYDTNGKVSEVLFRAYMKLLGITPSSKPEGLEALAAKGWILVNPIYTHVNKLPDKEADAMILANYPVFIADLKNLLGTGHNTPIILVKSNIVRLLEAPLLADGFTVLNKGQLVPFPLHYHAAAFDERVRSLLQL